MATFGFSGNGGFLEQLKARKACTGSKFFCAFVLLSGPLVAMACG
jgi:hypothetical protein